MQHFQEKKKNISEDKHETMTKIVAVDGMNESDIRKRNLKKDNFYFLAL